MRTANINSAAKAEIESIVAYYESELKGLGLEFVDEFERAMALLVANPYIGAPYRVEPFRKYVLHRFPFILFYHVTDDLVCLMAVAHERRRPDYWIRRSDN